MSHDQLIAAIRQREKQTEFGYGVQTADRYVKNMQQLAGLDLCYRYAATRKMSFDDVMKKAANTLVYSNEDMLIEEKASGVNARIDNIELPKNTLMVFKHILTTPRKDRDGDVLRTEGAIVDPRMLLLWQHVHTLPIGKMLAVSEHNSKRLTLFSCIVDINELAHDAAVMVDNDMARFSHGFRALEYSQLKESEGSTTGDGGFDIKRFEIMEESIVSVPSNADAEVNEVIVELVEGGKLTSDLMKEVGRSMRREMPLLVASGISLVAEKQNEPETKSTLAPSEKAQDNGAKGKGSDEEKDSCPQVPQVEKADESMSTSEETSVVEIEVSDVDDAKSAVVTETQEKAGRTLSAANLKTITDVCDDLKSIVDSDKNLSRGSQAICERCVGRLEKLVESVKPDESEEETEKEVTEHALTIKEAMAFILSNGSDADRTKLLGVLQIMEAARKEAEAAKEYYAIFA